MVVTSTLTSATFPKTSCRMDGKAMNTASLLRMIFRPMRSIPPNGGSYPTALTWCSHSRMSLAHVTGRMLVMMVWGTRTNGPFSLPPTPIPPAHSTSMTLLPTPAWVPILWHTTMPSMILQATTTTTTGAKIMITIRPTAASLNAINSTTARMETHPRTLPAAFMTGTPASPTLKISMQTTP